MTLNDDEIRIVLAVGEIRKARAERFKTWTLALAAALVVSVAQNACNIVQHHADMQRCAERAL